MIIVFIPMSECGNKFGETSLEILGTFKHFVMQRERERESRWHSMCSFVVRTAVSGL